MLKHLKFNLNLPHYLKAVTPLIHLTSPFDSSFHFLHHLLIMFHVLHRFIYGFYVVFLPRVARRVFHVLRQVFFQTWKRTLLQLVLDFPWLEMG